MTRKDLLTIYVYNLSALLQAAQSAANVSIEVGDTPMMNYMLIAMQPWKFLLEQTIEDLKAESEEAEEEKKPAEESKPESLDDLLNRLGDDGDRQ